ncbi:hypothetical protein MHYP_G00093240 [Metynnis hypsauchen]
MCVLRGLLSLSLCKHISCSPETHCSTAAATTPSRKLLETADTPDTEVERFISTEQEEAKMGGSSSLEFEQPWRNVDWNGRGKLEGELRNTKIESSDVSHLRILLHGQIGVGKSCFINSVDSAFQHEIINRAGEASNAGKSYTKRYKTYKIRNGNCGFLPFVMNDVMGLENKDGIQPDDVISALLGHVKEGYEFNPGTPLMEGDCNYVSNPSPDDKVHCLVTVVSANNISLMDQSAIDKMKTVRERANNIGIPQIVLMTKIDEACPLVKEDLKKTYTSKKIYEKIKTCSEVTGASEKFIFPVKNYCYESDTNDLTDILIMLALRHIIGAAHDYVTLLPTEH